MCTILSKHPFIGKNYDSAVDAWMMFTNNKGLIKQSAVFPPDHPLEWVSVYGSITFSQSGKEMPVSGVNEAGLVVEQATLLETVYPEQEGKPAAGSLEATQFLLDICINVEQALTALEQIAIVKTSWPIHYALFDGGGNMAVVEYLNGGKQVYEGDAAKARMLSNTGYRHEEMRIECRWTEDMFENLNEFRRPDTVWSNAYDLSRRKIYLKQAKER